MELFKLVGEVALTGTDKAKKELDDIGNKGEQSESKLGSAFSKIGSGALKVGKVVAQGLAVGAAGVSALVTAGVASYAEYEQLVGGVDTLFKTSSQKVQEYAKKAYQTAGLSANKYMETVTSFSASLLQSLNGDTEKAAKAADQAIIDMSDNANKMGTSMEMIQNAYQGFAKQNYTMLDNLKLGYGGTKTEMERLIEDANKLKVANGQMADLSIDSFADVTEAIHLIQTEMGITGTTSAEAAGTITGSLSSIKGAWSNLVTAFTSDDLPIDEYITAFVDSVIPVANNMLPRIEKALEGVVQLIEKLAPKVIEAIPKFVSRVLPSIVGAASSLIGAVVAAFPELVVAITNMLPEIISAFVNVFNVLIESLPMVIEALVAALPTLIPALINGLVSMIVTLCSNFAQIIQPIIDYLPEIIISIVNALISNLPILIEGLVQLVIGLVLAIPQILSALWETIKTLASNFVTSLFDNIKEWIMQHFPKSGEAIIKVLGSIKEAFTTWINNIKEVVSVVVEFISVPFKLAWNTIETIWNTVVDYFKMIWANIKEVFSVVDNILAGDFDDAWEGIKRIWSNVKDFFSKVVENIKTALSNVGEILLSPFRKAKDAIGNIVDNIKGFFTNLKLKFPSIKLPHFSVTPKGWQIGDLLKGKIPKLGIEWYAKAMDKGMILDEPTIFGVNSNGVPMGAGEAGSETVVGTNSLMNMIDKAVKANTVQIDNSGIEKKLESIMELMQKMKVELDGEEVGNFVVRTVEKEVFN